ncbi:hypothetical protein BaRGS_00035848, partial [Batillaria attramentaria]
NGREAVYQEVWAGMQRFAAEDSDVLSENTTKLAEKVRSENFVLFFYERPAQTIFAEDCRVVTVDAGMRQTLASLVLPKGSALTRPISDVIQRLHADGILAQWTANWFPRATCPTASGPIVISLIHLQGVLLIVSVGLGLAFVVLIVEIVYSRANAPFFCNDEALERQFMANTSRILSVLLKLNWKEVTIVVEEISSEYNQLQLSLTSRRFDIVRDGDFVSDVEALTGSQEFSENGIQNVIIFGDEALSGEWVSRMVKTGEESWHPLNVMLLCSLPCVQSALHETLHPIVEASRLEQEYGTQTAFGMSSRWLLIPTGGDNLLDHLHVSNVTMDNVALLSTASAAKQKYRGRTPVRCNHLERAVVHTLMWTDQGRTWANVGDISNFINDFGKFTNQVKTKDLVRGCEGCLTNKLFPNTRNGYNGRHIHVIAKEDVDVGLAPTDVLLERMEMMDFSAPIIFSTVVMAYRKPEVSRDFRMPFGPLSTWVWLGTGGSLLLVSVIVTLLEVNVQARCASRRETSHGHRLTLWSWLRMADRVVQITGAALLAEASEVTLRSRPGRVLLSSWWMFSLVMAAAYSGTLTAFLSATKDTQLFSSLQDLVTKEHDYTWGTPGGTALTVFLQRSNETILRDVWAGMKRFEAEDPDVFSENITKLAEKVVSEDFVLFQSEVFAMSLFGDECDVAVVPVGIKASMVSIAFPKGSSLVRPFTDITLRLHADGILALWTRTWFPRAECSSPSGPVVISLLHVQGVFLVVSVGLALALVVLMVERLSVVQQTESFLQVLDFADHGIQHLLMSGSEALSGEWVRRIVKTGEDSWRPLNIVMLCSLPCVKSALHKASDMEQEYGTQSAFGMSSRWLLIPTGGDNLLDHLHVSNVTMDNVAVADFKPRLSCDVHDRCKWRKRMAIHTLLWTKGRYEILEPADGLWGTGIAEDADVGAYGHVIRRNVDLGLVPTDVIPQRAQMMEFSVPVLYTPIVMVYRKPEVVPHLQTLRGPLSMTVLWTVGGALVIVSSLIFVMEVATGTRDQQRAQITNDLSASHPSKLWNWLSTLDMAVQVTGAAVLCEPSEVTLRSRPGRVLLSSWWMFSLVMAAAYSGTLTAFLSVSKDTQLFTSLQDLVTKQHDYKWGTSAGLSLAITFKNSTEPLLQEIWMGMQGFAASDPDILTENTTALISKVRSENFVFMSTMTYARSYFGEDCDIAIVDARLKTSLIGLVLPKGSSLTRPISDMWVFYYNTETKEEDNSVTEMNNHAVFLSPFVFFQHPETTQQRHSVQVDRFLVSTDLLPRDTGSQGHIPASRTRLSPRGARGGGAGPRGAFAGNCLQKTMERKPKTNTQEMGYCYPGQTATEEASAPVTQDKDSQVGSSIFAETE